MDGIDKMSNVTSEILRAAAAVVAPPPTPEPMPIVFAKAAPG